MKAIFFLLLVTMPLLAHSQNILIRSAGASPQRFEEFLKQHPEIPSFLVHLQSRLQKETTQENQLFQLGDALRSNTAETLLQLTQIQKKNPLALTSLRYIRDLTDKALQQKLSSTERQDFSQLHCKTAALLSEEPVTVPCDTQLVTFKELQKKYPYLEKVFIESVAFTMEETTALSSQALYQWTLASNSQLPITFYGTYEQLLNQHFVFENFVEGPCETFATPDLDFELTHQGMIYFSDDCIQRVQKNSEQKSWIKENKTWLITAGVLIVGGLVYAMKDKKMVINTSTLK